MKRRDLMLKAVGLGLFPAQWLRQSGAEALTIVITKLTETDTYVSLGWTPVTGATGYRFSNSLSGKKTHTWDPNIRRDLQFPACNTRFPKGATWYKVEGLGVQAEGQYPAVAPPPPPPPPPPSTWPSSFFTGPAGQNIILPPKQGILLGTHADGPRYGYQGIPGYYTNFETYLGRKLDLECRYWNDSSSCTIDAPLLANIWSRGHIPFVTWHPQPNNGGAILAGQADNCIRSVGQQIAAQPHKLMFRPFHEFNGNWYPWSKNQDGSMLTTAQFKALWIRVVDILRSTGACEKLSIIWAPHGGYYMRPSPASDGWVGIDARASYPGDNYVDWVGIDEYSNLPHQWREFAPYFAPFEAEWRGRKPFQIAETGCHEDPADPNRKANWFRNAGNQVTQASHPGLLAVSYFDLNWSDGNWSIDSSAASKAGFKEMALKPYFNTR